MFKKFFYRQFPIIASYNAKGELERPAGVRTVPRFKWVSPYEGWFNDEPVRQLTGEFHWNWGFMICNDVGIYQSFFRRLKWEMKKLWCIIRYQGHDRGGMFYSCSRCAD